MHCLFRLSPGTLVEVVLRLMGASTTRARARLRDLGYLDFLVTHIQSVMRNLGCPDGMVLWQPVFDQAYGPPVDGGELGIHPLILLQ